MLSHKGTVCIKTKRLLLRPFTLQDAPDMYRNWASDPEVTRYLTWLPHRNLCETENILSAWCVLYDDPHIYNWAIEFSETGEVIGNVSVVNRSERHENCELGYCLSRRFWGQALMPEAVSAVLQFLFHDVGFHRVSAWHLADNLASGRVMQKCGMLHEGTTREAWLTRDGTFADLCVYGITRDQVELRKQGEQNP